ncbi:MAG: DUF5320 domain-containing protein [Candidatus Marinimicrobia bacterium]|nr:DUF5320 domain-containing protein [Candidatus Neomarinimicrobiota bacterium]
MPRGDGTGPAGMGPMTGRAAGFCAGNNGPGYTNPGAGRGFGGGMGRGRGRGFRNWFYATGLPGWARFGGFNAPYAYPPSYQKPDPAVEKQALMNQAQFLEEQLQEIKERISALEGQKDK